jgi:hypothetical protein
LRFQGTNRSIRVDRHAQVIEEWVAFAGLDTRLQPKQSGLEPSTQATGGASIGMSDNSGAIPVCSSLRGGSAAIKARSRGLSEQERKDPLHACNRRLLTLSPREGSRDTSLSFATAFPIEQRSFAAGK